MEYLIKNFFNEAEIEELKSAAKINEHDSHISTGRSVTQVLEPLFVNRSAIIEKVQKAAKDLYSKEYKIVTDGFMEWSLKYGPPKLQPHMDDSLGEVVFDCQLDSNIDWPIYIDGKEYLLKDGDALFFNGEISDHWRPRRSFVDGEFVKIVIFNLIPEDHWFYTKKINAVGTREEIDQMNRDSFDRWKHIYMSD